MKYMLLIYGSEATTLSEAEQKAELNEYFAFTKLVREQGVLVDADALHPTATATTVRVRDGKTLTADGPFAETKEQLGGYYMVDCATIEEALEYAAKIPGARDGSIEVRPIVVFG
jgi:hypothetical protein